MSARGHNDIRRRGSRVAVARARRAARERALVAARGSPAGETDGPYRGRVSSRGAADGRRAARDRRHRARRARREGLTIEANASDAARGPFDAAAVVTAEDGVFAWKIIVVPLARNAGYLSVIVAGRVDGVAQARAVTCRCAAWLPLGQRPPRKSPAEAIIALPVQETP